MPGTRKARQGSRLRQQRYRQQFAGKAVVQIWLSPQARDKLNAKRTTQLPTLSAVVENWLKL